MSETGRDILELLREELGHVERGGYWRSPLTPPLPVSVFQDSKTCLNFGFPYRARACGECALAAFVPEGRRAEELPCHHIPLDADGVTVEDLEEAGDEEVLREKLRGWLRSKIREIETARYASRIY
jgi:hypothetical protein